MGLKGERTRAQLLSTTAALMNRHGYLDVPLSAVLEATGLQKGGLYRHFDSREALAHAAFEHAVGQVRERLLGALEGHAGAAERLHALLDAYLPRDAAEALAVPLPGGCPIMNCAIEADHADAGLRAGALAAMQQWRGLIERIVRAGVKSGELRAGLDAAEVSAVFVGQLEGAVMLSHLHGQAQPLQAAVRHLRGYVDDALCAPRATQRRPS